MKPSATSLSFPRSRASGQGIASHRLQVPREMTGQEAGLLRVCSDPVVIGTEDHPPGPHPSQPLVAVPHTANP